MRILPRIQGKVIQDGSRWIYEIYVSIGPTEPIVMVFDKENHLNEMAAKNALRATAADVMRKVCEALGAPEPADLYDLNNGVVQTIEEFAKPDKPGERNA